MEREEGGGLRMGNTCKPVADHVDIWKNQYNIVKLKNKIKLKKKIKKIQKINRVKHMLQDYPTQMWENC